MTKEEIKIVENLIERLEIQKEGKIFHDEIRAVLLMLYEVWKKETKGGKKS